MVDDKITHMRLGPNKESSIFLKSKFILLIIGLSLSLVTCSKPDFYLFDGTKGSIADLEGKWVVINYWADWCPPCIKELPELSKFYQENKNEVVVWAFNFDQLEGEELEEQIARFKVNVPVLMTNPGEVFGWDSPEGLPATYILDPKGVLRESLVGPQTQESLEKLIKKLQSN